MAFFFPGKYNKIINALKSFGLSVYEGTKHSRAKCIKNGKKTTIPRHNDISREVVNEICKFLLKKDFKEEDILKSIR
ncbi:MAG: addiction module toxin, HicA family [Flavobacterium sp.]|nr:addiction module toxin, HicA family [Flavobacterium sp.]